MVLPDDPGFPPPIEPQPAAEFRSDPGAIRTFIVAVAVCTLAALVLSFMQNRGIGEPTLFGYTSSNPFSDADPATGWVANLWHLLTPLALVSIAVASWHVLQGSPLTRTIIKVLLTAWVAWTIAGVMSVSLMPSDRDRQYINAHPGPNGKGGVGIEEDATSVMGLVKFAITGLGSFFLLGLITMRPDRDADPALRISDTTALHVTEGSSLAKRRRMSPNLGMEPSPLDASYAAFCPDCGQQVHARNGNCLYCGGGVHAL